MFRVWRPGEGLWDAYTLFWALGLKAVREQWRRIALMQTNREDCGDRYRVIHLPKPPSRDAGCEASAPFRTCFSTLAAARGVFLDTLRATPGRCIASVSGAGARPTRR